MTIINQTKYLQFKSAKSPSGSEWHYVRRTNDSNLHDSAVVITTLVKKNDKYHFLFIKTQRPPIYAENKAKYCLESPAGLIADENIQEKLDDCIEKELLEETGLKANKYFIELTNSCTSGGLSSETLTYVTAFVENYNVIKQPVDDGGILVERFLIKADKIDDYIAKEKEICIASPTICGLYFAKNRLNNQSNY